MKPAPKDFLGTTFFSTGLTYAGEIEGFSQIGWNVGISALDLLPRRFEKQALEPERIHELDQAILALRNTSTLFFYDSGAFSEVKWDKRKQRLVVVPENVITPKKWEFILDNALRYAKVLGSHMYFVAPDRVGSQKLTFKRLIRYADRIREIRGHGANVMVPFQRGKWVYPIIKEGVDRILRFPDWIQAFPMKKAATPVEALVEYVSWAKPHRIHLLGMSPWAHKFAQVVGDIKYLSPQTQITCDATRIRAMKGRKGKVRPLTAAADAVRDMLREDMHDAVFGMEYTDSMADMDLWLDPVARRRFASCLRLEGTSEEAEIMESPQSWMDRHERWDEWTNWCLDKEWEHASIGVAKLDPEGAIKRVEGGELTRSPRRREAIKLALGDRNLIGLWDTFGITPQVEARLYELVKRYGPVDKFMAFQHAQAVASYDLSEWLQQATQDEYVSLLAKVMVVTLSKPELMQLARDLGKKVYKSWPAGKMFQAIWSVPRDRVTVELQKRDKWFGRVANNPVPILRPIRASLAL